MSRDTIRQRPCIVPKFKSSSAKLRKDIYDRYPVLGPVVRCQPFETTSLLPRSVIHSQGHHIILPSRMIHKTIAQPSIAHISLPTQSAHPQGPERRQSTTGRRIYGKKAPPELAELKADSIAPQEFSKRSSIDPHHRVQRLYLLYNILRVRPSTKLASDIILDERLVSPPT